MKNTALLLACALCLAAALPATAQCDVSKFMNHCNVRLSNGYTFLKSYNIEKVKATNNVLEFSYVFSKNTDYLLTLCNQDGVTPRNFTVSLYNRERQLQYSNYDARTRTHYPAFQYKSGSTGIYYIRFEFANSTTPDCGGSVLSFKR